MSDSVTPWAVAHQAHLSMEFSRQEYWSGLPCPPPGDLPNLGIEPKSPALQADSSEPPGNPVPSSSTDFGNPFTLLPLLFPFPVKFTGSLLFLELKVNSSCPKDSNGFQMFCK